MEQQTRINDLSASLREWEQKVAQDEQLLEHDRYIRKPDVRARSVYRDGRRARSE